MDLSIVWVFSVVTFITIVLFFSGLVSSVFLSGCIDVGFVPLGELDASIQFGNKFVNNVNTGFG